MNQDSSVGNLRITMLCSSTVWAGTEKWSLRAAEELARRGHDVSFIARRPRVFMERAATPGQVVFRQLPLANDMDAASLIRLAWWLKRHSDILISTRVRDYWLGGIAAKLAGVPELLRLGVERRPRETYWRDRLRYGKLPSAILVNACSIRDILATSPLIDPETVHVVYNGVETPGPLADDERMKARRELGVANDEILLLGAGRLAVEKRWQWVVEAVVELRKRDVPVRAIVFGEGNERATLETAVRDQNVGDWITFPGTTTELDRWLGAADVAVMASVTEGVSNAMLEALGRGVATVATSAGGASEKLVSGRDLLLVPADDKPGYIDRLAEVCSDPELRARLGKQGLATVRREFSWTRMGEELERVLEAVISVR